VDLDAERRLIDLLATLAEEGRLASAHDVSDGGLAVALAECAMEGNLGAAIELDSGLRLSSLLFGETTGRAVISFAPEAESAIRAAADSSRVPFSIIGRVGGDRLSISVRNRTLIDDDVTGLTSLWRGAFVHAIEAADVL
jgi:phosphoribosylformylglycinamidine synthase